MSARDNATENTATENTATENTATENTATENTATATATENTATENTATENTATATATDTGEQHDSHVILHEENRRAAVLARRLATEALAREHAAYLVYQASQNAALNAMLSGLKGNERKATRATILRERLPHGGGAFSGRFRAVRGSGAIYSLVACLATPGGSYRLAGDSLKCERAVRTLATPANVLASVGTVSRSAKRRAEAAKLAALAAKGASDKSAARKDARDKFNGTGLPTDETFSFTFEPIPGGAPGVYLATAPFSTDSGSWVISGRVTVTDWTPGDVA